MHIDIVTPNGHIFDADADEITVPGMLGELGLMPGHIPIITALDVGELSVRQGSKVTTFAVEGGFLEIARDRVNVVTERALRPDQISADHIAELRAKARAGLADAEASGPAAVAMIVSDLRRADILEQIAQRNRA